MKQNIRFIITVASLLLLSSITLTGCMYAVMTNPGRAKPYESQGQHFIPGAVQGGDDSSSVLDDTPTPQNSLQAKFNPYLHIDKDENAVTVFSEQQYKELTELRKNGGRSPLTYDEVLFLINDSVNLYFSYDEIRLYNACVDRLLPAIIEFAQIQSGNACIIYPYHGDYSEFESLDAATKRYNRVIQEIYALIYYRIYIHDAGFEAVKEAYKPSTGSVVFSSDSWYGEVNSLVPKNSLQLLSFNGGKVSGAENRAHLVKEWEKIVRAENKFSSDYTDPDYTFEALDAPLLITHTANHVRTQQHLYKFYVASPNDGNTTEIYPTYELKTMLPTGYDLYVSGDAENDDYGPYFALNRYLNTFSMSLSSFQSFALIGKYHEDGGVMKLYPENAEHGTEGYFCYVLTYEDGAWVYSRDNSNPPGGSFDIEDGLCFTLAKNDVYSPYYEKPIQSIRDHAREQNIPTDTAPEPFFEDEKYIYLFSSVRSEHVIVTFADGTAMPVREALEKGYINIRALDIYSIHYLKEEKR